MPTEIVNFLYSVQDPGYRSFQSKLIPTVDPERIIGVRMPILRAFAGKIKNTETALMFVNDFPHSYYDEDNLHALLVGEIRDASLCIREIDRFLPYVDNWATCDSIRPKCFCGHPEGLNEAVEKWISSDHAYTVRFGIEMRMLHDLGDSFLPEYLAQIGAIKSREYYVNMMIAWYFATALAMRWTETVPFFTERRLPSWIHQKALQKALESNRISQDRKSFLRALK